ncbi:MAG: M4 family metallopeptidase, partial [Pseudomonadota bacterium]
MHKNIWKSVLWTAGIASLVAVSSCEREQAPAGPEQPAAMPAVTAEHAALPAEIRAAVSALPMANVQTINSLGVPSFLSGDLGHAAIVPVSAIAVERDMAPVVSHVAPALGGRADELRLNRFAEDELGFLHVRYDQVKNSLPVINGEVFVNVDSSGRAYAAGGLLAGEETSPEPTVDANAAMDAAETEAQTPTSRFTAPRLVYIYLPDDTGQRLRLAWEMMEFGGPRDGVPVQDSVYVDAHEGRVVRRYPNAFAALNRKIWTFNGATTYPVYPAWLAAERMEGEAPVADANANAAYDRMGDVYSCVSTLLGMDSYTGKGAPQEFAINHGDANQIAAVGFYYDGVGYTYRPHIALGDGDGTTFASPMSFMDTIGHEFGHLIVSETVNLKYEYESAALHESYADILGAVCEAWKTYGAVDNGYDANTWKCGESLDLAHDAVRYMNDPYYDCSHTTCSGQYTYPACSNGQLPPNCWYSVDHYSNKWPYGVGVQHLNNGISNLAFKLLVTGGSHPRRSDPTSVVGIGIVKARQIFFRGLTRYMHGLSNFADARSATVQAAIDLFGASSQERKSTEVAWNVVGVLGGSGIHKVIPLGFSAANKIQNIAGGGAVKHYFQVTVPANATNLVFTVTPGTGTGSDPDLYVSYGTLPFAGSDRGATTSDYQSENDGLVNETITVASAAAGTWYALVYNRKATNLVNTTIQVTATCANTETCDNTDQDCDGLVDESTLFGTAGKVTGAALGQVWGMLVDGAHAGGRMYVTGLPNLRIEKRKLANGALDTALFDDDGIAPYDGIAINTNFSATYRTILVNGYLYTVGRNGTTVPAASLAIEKRSASTGRLDTTFDGDGIVYSTWDGANADTSSDSNNGLAIATDGTSLYVVGNKDGASDGTYSLDWLIEKRSLTTGALDTSFDGDGHIEGPAVTVNATGIAVNSLWLYVVGWEYSTATGKKWRIEKRKLSDGSLDPDFDGDDGLNPGNGVLTLGTIAGELRAIVIDESNMYITGVNTPATATRVEKRGLGDGKLMWGVDTTALTGAD